MLRTLSVRPKIQAPTLDDMMYKGMYRTDIRRLVKARMNRRKVEFFMEHLLPLAMVCVTMNKLADRARTNMMPTKVPMTGPWISAAISHLLEFNSLFSISTIGSSQ